MWMWPLIVVRTSMHIKQYGSIKGSLKMLSSTLETFTLWRKLPGVICCYSLREILSTVKVQTERAGLRAILHAQLQLLLYLLTYTCYLQSKFVKNRWKEKTFLKKGPKYKTTAVHCHSFLFVCLFVFFCENDINRLVCITPIKFFSY